jgi:hypothetical protein
MLFGILTPLHTAGLFLHHVSLFLMKTKMMNEKQMECIPKSIILEFGDMYGYDKKNYDYNKFKNTNFFLFYHPSMITIKT